MSLDLQCFELFYQRNPKETDLISDEVRSFSLHFALHRIPADKRQLKCIRTFWDDKLCRNRSITDVDWSTRVSRTVFCASKCHKMLTLSSPFSFSVLQHPELSVASYSRNELSDSPDGLVLVWNMHLSDRPEFVFHAQVSIRFELIAFLDVLLG